MPFDTRSADAAADDEKSGKKKKTKKGEDGNDNKSSKLQPVPDEGIERFFRQNTEITFHGMCPYHS